MLTGALDNPLGDGGIRDKNFGSLLMVAVFGPVGCIIVAHFIAAVVREQERKFALDIRHEENQAFVKRALENLNVPTELQRRVFSLHHFQKMSHDYEAFEQLFKNHTLSSPLEDAIRVYLYQSVLRAGFFKDKEHSYILAVVRVLEDKAFLPGDYVVRVGEVADEMYFISKGEVSVLVAQGKSKDVEDAIQLPMRKREGDYFGEVALIKGSLRTAWIKVLLEAIQHRTDLEVFPTGARVSSTASAADCHARCRETGSQHSREHRRICRFSRAKPRSIYRTGRCTFYCSRRCPGYRAT